MNELMVGDYVKQHPRFGNYFDTSKCYVDGGQVVEIDSYMCVIKYACGFYSTQKHSLVRVNKFRVGEVVKCAFGEFKIVDILPDTSGLIYLLAAPAPIMAFNESDLTEVC